MTTSIDSPWLIGGDFNEVLNVDKMGWHPIQDIDYQDFNKCIFSCKMIVFLKDWIRSSLISTCRTGLIFLKLNIFEEHDQIMPLYILPWKRGWIHIGNYWGF